MQNILIRRVGEQGQETQGGDMHHIFPARVLANSDRGSLPYNEINDNSTEFWYINSTRTSNKPSTNIDGYSEKINGFFEPRESVKGDVARAIMYFYTMYKPQADSADPDFFDQQKDILCQWHYDDPVDQKEWERTFNIATYQQDKPNPYVLDCSLAERAYCNNSSLECQTTPTEDIVDYTAWNLSTNLIGNDKIVVYLNSVETLVDVRFYIYNLSGQLIHSIGIEHQGIAHEIDVQNVRNGLYLLVLQTDKFVSTKRIIIGRN